MYVPTVNEILEGLQRVMDQVVIPAIEDQHSRQQAMIVSRELQQLCSRQASIYDLVKEENEEMKAALEQSLAQLKDERLADAEEIREEIKASLAHHYPPDQPPRSVTSLASEGQTLRQAIEQSIVLLHPLQQRHPEAQLLTQVRATLRKVIKAQAKRRQHTEETTQHLN